MKPEILSSSYLIKHQYFTARQDSYKLASGKIVDPYFVVEIPPSIVAMAITKDRQVILVKQYRHPVQKELLELPGGFIDEGENPEDAVARELLEETGYKFDRIVALGSSAPNPGILNNECLLYLAMDGVKFSAQSLDPNEEIEIILKPISEVRSLLAEGAFKQSLHAVCLFYAFSFLDQRNA